jgi:hypothetical protein
VPRPSKALSFEERILIEFPQAAELARDRIFTTRSQTFFDNHEKEAKYTDNLASAGLYLAMLYAHQAGLVLILTAKEKKLCGRTFKLGP